MVNNVTLIGNLVAAPESRTTPSGVTVANLRLATSHRQKQGDEWVEKSEFHRVVCFSSTAENVVKYCQKGKQLFVSGRIQTTKYQAADGSDRWSTEIVAQTVKFLGGKADQGGQQSQASSTAIPF